MLSNVWYRRNKEGSDGTPLPTDQDQHIAVGVLRFLWYSSYKYIWGSYIFMLILLGMHTTVFGSIGI